MDDSRTYKIYPNDLDLYDAYKAFYEHLKKCNYTENIKSGCREIEFDAQISDERRLRTHRTDEFLEIIKQYRNPISTWTHCHWEKGDDDIGITIGVKRSEIDTTIKAKDLTIIGGLHDKICEVFQARNPIREKSSKLRYDLKRTVFVAHRFDKPGNDYANELMRFLRRLGFEVVEGEGYEARDIPAKVADRIKTQDIFICIVSEGDSSWILSEVAYAKGLSKYIIILVQDDLSFRKGIIGTDYEHLSFPNNRIERVYSDLLYALPIR